MAENTKITNLQLDRNIAQLNTKLSRQLAAVKDTEAHIAALKALQASQAKA